MKKKILKMFLAISLIIAIQYPIFSYAFGQQQERNEQSLLTSDKKEALAGDTAQLILNLAQIDYNNFEFSLTSSSGSLGDVEVNEQEVEVNKENDNIKIIVEKGTLNIDKITLNYTIPENAEVGSSIILIGTIKEIQDEDSEQEGNEKTATITIKVVEESENNENDEQRTAQGEIKEESEQQGNMQQNSKTGKTSNSQGNSQTTISIKSDSSSNSQEIETETNTYNGESNNYLKNLSIDGYNLTSEFSKTKTTYFINVENDVKSLTINAEAEDENATVTIYGNDNLTSGTNKILVAVTAENGDVKTYRIYVN